MTSSAARSADRAHPGAGGAATVAQGVFSVYDAEAVPDGDTEGDPAGDPSGGDASAPRYTVAAVARRLGVAPATLRTWARRYGLGPSEHVSGAHRRYTGSDLARLQRMRRLTLQGVTPSDAARLALVAPDEADADADESEVEPGPAGPAVATPPDRAAASGGAAAAGATAAVPVQAGRIGGPGGRVLAVPSSSPTARGLARAVLALDDEAITALLRERLQRDGVVATWEHVLAPVLVAVGQRWAATGDGVEAEHLLSECASAVLREVAAEHRAVGEPRPALLACAENDLHSLPLYALAAGLAEQGVVPRVLGAAMPTASLVSAVKRTGPVALFVWAQVRATPKVDGLDALPVLRPPVSVVVGGPGWRVSELPPRVAHAASLGEAVRLMTAATGR
ncbi:MAG: MerR family transcriptional regulator [Actinomycetota bacterium]|nr:MerR family transcriptional regulator [Actinomycetota bacterium]